MHLLKLYGLMLKKKIILEFLFIFNCPTVINLLNIFLLIGWISSDCLTVFYLKTKKLQLISSPKRHKKNR